MHHNADGAFGCEMNGRTWWVESGLGALMKNLEDLKRVCQFGPVHRLSGIGDQDVFSAIFCHFCYGVPQLTIESHRSHRSPQHERMQIR